MGKKIEVEDTPHSVDSASVSSRNDVSGGYGSSDEHVFKDPNVADYWRGIYEKARYENRHRFDPDFKWTAEEEKKLVRKVSFLVVGWRGRSALWHGCPIGPCF